MWYRGPCAQNTECGKIATIFSKQSGFSNIQSWKYHVNIPDVLEAEVFSNRNIRVVVGLSLIFHVFEAEVLNRDLQQGPYVFTLCGSAGPTGK
jgi:hypothetical protein